jgi:hypothetical protein
MHNVIQSGAMRDDQVPADERARLAAGLEAAGVPEHLRGGLVRYLVDRILPGGFLQAVLCNDLVGAVRRHHGAGAAYTITTIRKFLLALVPEEAWGSVEKVTAWTVTPDRLEIRSEDVVEDEQAAGDLLGEFLRRGLAASAAVHGILGGDLADVGDQDLIAAMAIELEACEAPIELVLRPSSALHLAGLLQLAMRHPALEARARGVALTYLGHVRAYFAEAPAVLEALRRGDDPARDRPVSDADRADVVGASVKCPLCDWTARNEVDDDPEAAARIERYLGAAFADHVRRVHAGPGDITDPERDR